MGWPPRKGHGSHGSWVKSSMGHLGHGSLWVTHSLLWVHVTKFRQNRLTLKGRSAGRSASQRHTDRQTGANFKCISSVSFVWIESISFAVHRRHKRKNRSTRILKFEFSDLWEFSWNFQIDVTRPIWTIMVVDKLDLQSRVLVTKFRRNRLTLKGRSDGQRQRDRLTDKRLKIMALQVCNWANRQKAWCYSVCNNRPHLRVLITISKSKRLFYTHIYP